MQLNASDLKQPIHFGSRKIIGRFIGGNAKFVQTTGFLLGVKQTNVMAMHRQAMRAGQPGGSSANHGDCFASFCGPLKRVGACIHQTVCRIAL